MTLAQTIALVVAILTACVVAALLYEYAYPCVRREQVWVEAHTEYDLIWVDGAAYPMPREVPGEYHSVCVERRKR